jgi:hypothetical protein
MMDVTGARVIDHGDAVRLEARVEDVTIFWELPAGWPVELRGEPFIAALLPAAMRRGVPLHLAPNLPTDPQFLRNVDRIQDIFVRWFPELTKIPIDAAPSPRRLAPRLRATGFSGGVDSSYSVDVLAPGLDAVLLIEGIEYPQPEVELLAKVAATLRDALGERDLEFVTIRTNVKQASRELGANWHQALGGVLASCAHAAGFASYAIAASNSWENLAPYGSHPLTDPLWSSAHISIGHHGAELRRIDKTRFLARVPALLDNLRVCFQGAAYNCGRCEKCLRTMVGLRVLGVRSAMMPELADPRLLRGLVISDDFALVDWEELLDEELESGDPVLHRELSGLVRRFRWRQLLKELDALLTGSRIRKTAHRLRGNGPS